MLHPIPPGHSESRKNTTNKRQEELETKPQETRRRNKRNQKIKKSRMIRGQRRPSITFHEINSNVNEIP